MNAVVDAWNALCKSREVFTEDRTEWITINGMNNVPELRVLHLKSMGGTYVLAVAVQSLDRFSLDVASIGTLNDIEDVDVQQAVLDAWNELRSHEEFQRRCGAEREVQEILSKLAPR